MSLHSNVPMNRDIFNEMMRAQRERPYEPDPNLPEQYVIDKIIALVRYIFPDINEGLVLQLHFNLLYAKLTLIEKKTQILGCIVATTICVATFLPFNSAPGGPK